MARDIMAPFRVGRTGNAELDDALARIEDVRQSLSCAEGACEDAGRDKLHNDFQYVDDALVFLAWRIKA